MIKKIKQKVNTKIYKAPSGFFNLFNILNCLSSAILISAFLMKIKLGTPMFFTLKRSGYNEKLFTMLKFRTMLNETDEDGIFFKTII